MTSERYFRRIVYSGGTSHECADTSQAVKLKINPLPGGDMIAAKDTICEGESLFVKFSVNGINGPFRAVLGNGSFTASKMNVTSGIDSVEVSPSSSGNIGIISIVDDSSCYADLTSNTNLAEVTVYQVPVANAGADKEVCGDITSLAAVKSINGSEGYWSGAGALFADPEDASSSVTAEAYGSNIFMWTESNWRCSDDDEVTVIFYEEPGAADAGPDQVVDFAFTATLEATPATAGTGKWTVSSGTGLFADESDSYSSVSDLGYENIFLWTVTNGVCAPESDSVRIEVKPLKLNKAITPNGDTRNDVFDPGVTNAEYIRIKIYNAAGVLVYSSDDYMEENLWGGFNINGVELPEGTYYYVLEVKMPGKQQELQYRSFVEILR